MTISDERRLVTVLFVDLVGFTGRAEASDPEVMREIQHGYFDAVATEIERYGGTVEKYIGDAVMAVFGAPRAHDDDAERALRAALAVRAAVAELGQELEVRIGVNSGEVVGGGAAGRHAGEYTVTGDAVNVAARLQQAADAGQIVVGEATRTLAGDAFEFAPLADLELRGKSQPVRGWTVVAARPSRPRVRGGDTPLVGRRREMSAVDLALAEATERGGLLLGVVGEAGIGKSRLALETRARAQAQGFETVWATARSYSGAFPYYLVGELLELLLARRSEAVLTALQAAVPGTPPATVRRWAAVVADVLGHPNDDAQLLEELTPSGRQHLLVQAIGAILRERAARQPQLVVLDDMHWADASSLAVLGEVIELVPDLAVVVLMLYRSGWTHPWAGRALYQQINLGALRDEEAGELVRHLTGVAGAGDGDLGRGAVDAADLLHRSGGNPFFLEELLRSAERGGDGGHGRLPETVHEVLLARIDALPDDARRLLQVAAVVGMEFSEDVLAALAPEMDVPQAVSELQRQDLVVLRTRADERGFAMRHPLVHEVAYRSLLAAHRRVLHRRTAEWLASRESDDRLSAIATHYVESDEPARGAEYLVRAAERAARLNAQDEALRLYRAAADLFAAQPARRAAMLERAATHSYLVGDLTASIEQVREAIGLYDAAGDRLHALDCRRWLGRYYWFDGHGREAEQEIIAAIEGLEELRPSRELALAYSYRSQMRMLMPDYETAEPLARRAIEIAEQVGAVDALTHALNNLGMCRAGQGDPEGVDLLRRSLALALEHNLADDASRAYTNLSGQGASIGMFPYEEAERLYDEMLEYDRRIAPGGAYEQWHRAGRAELWIAVGRWDEAELQLEELSGLTNANRYVVLDIAAFHALVAAYRGRYAEALERVEPHVEVAVRIDDMQAYAPVFATLSHALRGLGRTHDAVAALERCIELRGTSAEASISTWFLFEAVDIVGWLRLQPRDDTVGRAVESFTPLTATLAPLAQRGATRAETAVRYALFRAASEQLAALASRGGSTAPPADGRFAELRAAAAALDEHRRRFDAARIRLWLGEEGDGDALAAARDVFAELRASDYLARASAALERIDRS